MKTALIFGTFDIVHIGHLHMFMEAKEYGDELIVSVAHDDNVEKIKGARSMHSQDERKLILENIKIIDKVFKGYRDDVYRIIKETKPDIIALGYDQKVFVDKLAEKITEFGLNCQIVRLKPYYPNRFKSSKIKKYIERLV